MQSVRLGREDIYNTHTGRNIFSDPFKGRVGDHRGRDAGRLVGHYPLESDIRDSTGCAVVAVERAGEVIMDVPPSFVLTETDAVYVCGTVDAFNVFAEKFSYADAS